MNYQYEADRGGQKRLFLLYDHRNAEAQDIRPKSLVLVNQVNPLTTLLYHQSEDDLAILVDKKIMGQGTHGTDPQKTRVLTDIQSVKGTTHCPILYTGNGNNTSVGSLWLCQYTSGDAGQADWRSFDVQVRIYFVDS